MKNISRLVASMWILVSGYVTPTLGAELKPIWLTSACYQLRLSANDKLSSKGSHVAKYIVRAADGEIYLAEKAVMATDVVSSEVIFPDSFRNKNTHLQAYADCHYGQRYIWEIYVDKVLIDSGAIEFTRKKLH